MQFTKKLKTKKEIEEYQSSLGRSFARPSGMVRGVHRKSRRYRSACPPAHSSHDSDSERPTKVALRKHSVSTHFPKSSTRRVNLETITDTQSCKTNISEETGKSSRMFLESSKKPKVIFTDNSLEFGKSCEDLSWNHRTSTPHHFETNGIAERAVRRVNEGKSAELLHSGLDE